MSKMTEDQIIASIGCEGCICTVLEPEYWLEPDCPWHGEYV